MESLKRNTILVPVDFSDVAEYAIDHAAAIAQGFGYRVFLLHVIPKRINSKEKQQKADARLMSISSQMVEDKGLKVTHQIKTGNVFKIINEMADRLRPAFIVMGVQGKKGVEHLIGSYSYSVVCKADVPVLVVKDKHHHVGFKNIVVPIDFSKRSTQKVSQAVKFSRFFGAKIRVFGFLSSKNKAKIINKEALLKSVTTFFEEQEVPVTTDLRIKPGMDWPEALLGFAEDKEADLIMIVAERGGGIQDIFSSNYMERILDKAAMPVLTIMPCAEELAPESAFVQDGVVTPFIDPFGLYRGS